MGASVMGEEKGYPYCLNDVPLTLNWGELNAPILGFLLYLSFYSTSMKNPGFSQDALTDGHSMRGHECFSGEVTETIFSTSKHMMQMSGYLPCPHPT